MLTCYVKADAWNDPSGYRTCNKKIYTIHCCMPPKGTVVINKLEQYDAFLRLGSKDSFSLDELHKLSVSNPQRFQLLQAAIQMGKCYVVNDNEPFVLCGTVGELWTIGAEKLAKTYNFILDGKAVQINQQSLNSRLQNGCLNWTAVRTLGKTATTQRTMACFVPTYRTGQIKTSWGAVLNINGKGVSHGNGDFIVCDVFPDGSPMLSSRRVVNGNIFAATYSNKGWSEYLETTKKIKPITIADLPKLF